MAALLTVKNIQMTTATVTVNSEIVPRLNAYAAFTSSTPDAVIVAALEYVFTTDKEFIAFIDKHKDHPAIVAREGTEGTSEAAQDIHQAD
jgi:hypothetical protein